MGCIHQGKCIFCLPLDALMHNYRTCANKEKMVKTFCHKPFPLYKAMEDLVNGT